ncbi:type II secretion system protein GspH [Aliidiomarina minuta]|uniref:Type II secretion system protein GspH n=1 Tax=Aliidiomarina minuta TaxID=880057 RepID=A0A432W8N2_9GAMM|nr:type II secretion system protein [Aliidiomarina minuta]RUO26432.1 type II secretion system protein GspH [Aliidiomarina minuta]
MHNLARHQQRGFTLLEIMIVVLLLGIMAGAVVYTMPPQRSGSSAQDAAVVFKEKINHARQTALLRNWVIGVDIKESGYTFYRWSQGQWQLLSEPPLQEVQLPEDLAMELQLGDFAILDNIIDGDRSAVFAPGDRDRDEDRPQPGLLIFESTDFIPFQVAFHPLFQGYSYWVDGNDGLHTLLVTEEP